MKQEYLQMVTSIIKGATQNKYAAENTLNITLPFHKSAEFPALFAELEKDPKLRVMIRINYEVKRF